MSEDLAVVDTTSIPLEEVSGICTFGRTDGSTAMAAIGDASSILALTTVSDGRVGDWDELDLADLEASELPRRGTQAEALASDGTGLVLVLVEEPGAIFLFDLGLGRQTARIDLVVGADQPVARSWGKDTNSRGEGLVLLRDGHLLVLKEKDPPALLEFGPAESVPGGFDGRLYLLSDQDSSVARAAPGAPSTGGTVDLDQIRTIEGRPDKAEGLALLPDGRIYVALDTTKAKKNLLLLR